MTPEDKAEDVFNRLEGKKQCIWCHKWYVYPYVSDPDSVWDDELYCSASCYRASWSIGWRDQERQG